MTSSLKARALLGILPIMAFAFYAWHYGSEVPLTSDSPSYMYFGVGRPVGYPLFLAAVRAIFGTFYAAPFIQLALLCAALGWIACTFYALSGSLALSLALGALLLGNPGPFMWAHTLTSDSFSAICIAAFTALLLQMAARPGRAAMAGLIAISFIALTARFVNIAFFPATAAVIFLWGRGIAPLSRLSQCTLLLLALLFAYELTPAVHWLRGDPTVSSNPLALSLVQKTLFRQWPQDEASLRCEGALIAEDTKKADDYLAHTPDDIRPYAALLYSGYLRFRVIVPHLLQKHHLTGWTEADPILMCYALARIRQDPWYFVDDAIIQAGNLLSNYTFVTEREHERIAQYFDAHPLSIAAPIPRQDDDYALRTRAVSDLHLNPATAFPEDDMRLYAPQARPLLLSWVLCLLQWSAAAIMAAGIGFLPRRNDKSILYIQMAGILGLLFFAEIFTVAAVELAVPRYFFPLWPLVCVAPFLVALQPLHKKGRFG